LKKRGSRLITGEGGKKTPFRVFIIHGRSDDWKKVKRFIESQLQFETKVILLDVRGQTIISKVRHSVWQDCDCAVAILSADDLLADTKRNARPNVLFEIGYCMGFFDFRYWSNERLESVLLIKEDKTEIPSDLSGIEYIPFSRSNRLGIRSAFPSLRTGLESLYEEINEYFED
jgi:predicted nucleotide-binding protein